MGYINSLRIHSCSLQMDRQMHGFMGCRCSRHLHRWISLKSLDFCTSFRPNVKLLVECYFEQLDADRSKESWQARWLADGLNFGWAVIGQLGENKTLL